MADIYAASELRKKFTHFRILVIGRANAGKTTILKRVCNTTEDPRFYDEENNALLEPTTERGNHDINRPFVFKSNPEFIFHDSPGFEAGDKRQLEEVQAFIRERAKATNPRDQLHAIWFCFIPDVSRFLLDLEKRFFNEERAGNVPVIAIFTKFDDLINQVYDSALDENDNCQVAQDKLDKLKAPLFHEYLFPPKAGVCLEDMHLDEGKHQEYVKKLIKETVESLDSLALKMLLVSVQRNNLELCIEYAVTYGDIFSTSMRELVNSTIIWFDHPYITQADYASKIFPQHAKFMIIQNRKNKVITFVTEFLKEKFDEPSLSVLAALLICLTHSFWCQSQTQSFHDAFKIAFTIYMKSGDHLTISNHIMALERDESFKSSYAKLVIEHQISI